MDNIARLDEALTSKKWKYEFYEQSACPPDIFAFFRAYLPHLSADSFEERLKLGGFYINGISIYSNEKLTAPCKVEYYEPKFNLSEISNIYPEFSNDWVIFEDEYLIAVYKPQRLPSLPTKEQKIYNLKNYLENYCTGGGVHMPSRLDTSTQGLVIASKHPRMHNYLQQAFERKLITKRYFLASAVNPDWQVKAVAAAIGKSSSHAVLRTITSGEGKQSLTIFTKLAKRNNKNYFIARPLTGRTHQIRVHASHSGIPILGDNFYGGEKAPNLHLLSCQAGLWHPYNKKYMTLSVPERLLPEWCKESDCLDFIST